SSSYSGGSESEPVAGKERRESAPSVIGRVSLYSIASVLVIGFCPAVPQLGVLRKFTGVAQPRELEPPSGFSASHATYIAVNVFISPSFTARRCTEVVIATLVAVDREVLDPHPGIFGAHGS